MFRRIITRIGYAILGVFLVVPALARAASQNGPTKAPTCRPAGALTGVPELREGSGVAASKRSPGRFWAHNDSGEPALIALDSTGKALWWGFLGLAFSLVAALAGASIGVTRRQRQAAISEAPPLATTREVHP